LRGLPVSKPTASAARVLPVPGSPVKRQTVPARSPFLPKPHCPINTALAYTAGSSMKGRQARMHTQAKVCINAPYRSLWLAVMVMRYCSSLQSSSRQEYKEGKHFMSRPRCASRHLVAVSDQPVRVIRL